MKWKIGQSVHFGERKNRHGTITEITPFYVVVCDEKDGTTVMFEPDQPSLHCAHRHITREDYLNPCSSAACKQNGQHTYHLGCGSQYKKWCDDCGELIFDSADDEIENAEWEEVEYRCADCQDEIQPGHFACGEKFYIPK